MTTDKVRGMSGTPMNAGRGTGHRAHTSAYHALLTNIRNGVFAPGSRLPGERQLATQLEVSRATLRQALGRLAEEGHITAAAQRGWFVRPPRVVSEPPSQLQSFTEMAESRGLTPSTEVLSYETRPATFTEAEKLGIAPASTVLALARRRSLDGVRVLVDHSVIALSRTPGMDEADLTDRSLYATFQEVAGVQIVRSDYAVRAEAADAETADLLDLAPGDPVLVGEQVEYSLAEVPILCGQVVYRGDAYRFQASLFRPAET